MQDSIPRRRTSQGRLFNGWSSLACPASHRCSDPRSGSACRRPRPYDPAYAAALNRGVRLGRWTPREPPPDPARRGRNRRCGPHHDLHGGCHPSPRRHQPAAQSPRRRRRPPGAPLGVPLSKSVPFIKADRARLGTPETVTGTDANEVPGRLSAPPSTAPVRSSLWWTPACGPSTRTSPDASWRNATSSWPARASTARTTTSDGERNALAAYDWLLPHHKARRSAPPAAASSTTPGAPWSDGGRRAA